MDNDKIFTICENTLISATEHRKLARTSQTCDGEGAGKNSPPNRSMICSSATSLVGVAFGGGGTGGPFLSCQKNMMSRYQMNSKKIELLLTFSDPFYCSVKCGATRGRYRNDVTVKHQTVCVVI